MACAGTRGQPMARRRARADRHSERQRRRAYGMGGRISVAGGDASAHRHRQTTGGRVRVRRRTTGAGPRSATSVDGFAVRGFARPHHEHDPSARGVARHGHVPALSSTRAATAGRLVLGGDTHGQHRSARARYVRARARGIRSHAQSRTLARGARARTPASSDDEPAFDRRA